MSSLNVSVEGVGALSRKLRDLGADVPAVLARAGTKGMLVLEASIKEKAPVRTGELRDSYVTETGTEGDTVTVTTGTNKEYAVYQEYGTGAYAEAGNGRTTPWAYIGSDGEWHYTIGSPAKPHVRPALDETRDKIPAVVMAELEDELRRRSM